MELSTSQKTVEYFSHPWKDVDLFRTWRENTKHNITTNGRRLENLTWRRFFQQKFQLKKLSPSLLNWQKSSDSLWLYGPLVEIGGSQIELDLSIIKGKKSRILKRKSDPTHDIPALAGGYRGSIIKTIVGRLNVENSSTQGGISF